MFGLVIGYNSSTTLDSLLWIFASTVDRQLRLRKAIVCELAVIKSNPSYALSEEKFDF